MNVQEVNANFIPRHCRIQHQTSETNSHQAPLQNLADKISTDERKCKSQSFNNLQSLNFI